MCETRFIITVDTEGDDLWTKPGRITTRNAEWLPRFQALSEHFGFKPVYLTNYEMAMSGAFVEFARDALRRGTAEIGMHLHAWNSPPLNPLTDDDFRHQPYATEYPESTLREKVRRLTHLLEDRFDRKMVSHRGGRWALDGRYVAVLLEEGYRVDCSVTPGIDWRPCPGAPRGSGGPDYRTCGRRPYFLSPRDLSVPAAEGLLEVPMTVRTSCFYRRTPPIYAIPLLRRFVNRLSPALSWLCPVQPTLTGPVTLHLDVMLAVARAARLERPAHLEFMLHSSELMPGGSPTFRSESDIEALYAHLEILFEEVSAWARGSTLAGFYEHFTTDPRAERAQAQARPGHHKAARPRGGVDALARSDSGC